MTVSFLAPLVQAMSNMLVSMNAKNAVDFCIVASLVYLVLVLFRRSGSYVMLQGVLFLFLLYACAAYFHLYLTSLLFGYFFTFFIVVFVIIFQRELRTFFEWLPMIGRMRGLRRSLSATDVLVGMVRSAVDTLAKNKTGALIVFPGFQPVDRFLEKGTPLNGDVSTTLLLSIFDTSSPGHDGAVVIRGNKISRFGVHLPLAERESEQLRGAGTRHRAALGLVERTDALVLVVSEERGTISLAQNGTIKTVADSSVCAAHLHSFLDQFSAETERGFLKKVLFSYVPEKILALLITTFLWFVFVVQGGVIHKELLVPVEFKFLGPNLAVESVRPTEVGVSLSGKALDFNLLNPEDVQVVVNATGFKTGSYTVTLTPKNVEVTGNFSVDTVTPDHVTFRVQ